MPNKIDPLQILLIEDNEHDRIAFQRAIKKGLDDCTITVCERAEDAETLLNGNDRAFDLAVVDFDLPGMNGLDFFKKMKGRKNMPPCVMLTGAGSEQIAVEALLQGM